MLFTLISDTITEHPNPFITRIKSSFEPSDIIKSIELETGNSKVELRHYFIFESFEKVLEYFPEANFLESLILDKKDIFVCWSSDIDNYICELLKIRVNDIKKHAIFDTRTLFGNFISFEDENIKCYYDGIEYHLLSKNLCEYFDTFTQEVPVFLLSFFNYKTTIRRKIKEYNLLDSKWVIDNLISYFKEKFEEEYFFYITLFFYEVKRYSERYGKQASYYNNGSQKYIWGCLFVCEEYFSNVKIFNVDSTPGIDFPFKMDKETNKQYIQYEYSCESLTGRIYPKNIEPYQSLQNLPKDKRYLLKAEEGCQLCEIDFNNFEFNILLSIYEVLSGEILLKIDKETSEVKFKDFHTETSIMLGITDRNYAKKINYSLIYGMSLYNVAAELEATLKTKTAEEYIKQLQNWEYFHIIKSMRKSVEKKYVHEDEILLTVFDRAIKYEKEHAILNNFIQGSAVDIFAVKIVDIILELKALDEKNKILVQNHDSILLQLENDLCPRYINRFQYLMKKDIDRIHFDVTIKVGANWGNLQKL